MKLSEIKQMKSKEHEAFLSLCYLYNTSNKTVRKSLIPAMRSLCKADAYRKFVREIEAAEDVIDIERADKLASSIPSMKVNTEDMLQQYTEYIDSLDSNCKKFMLVRPEKTPADIEFYIRYGVSLNKSFFQDTMHLSDVEFREVIYSSFQKKLMKFYVAPQISKFVTEKGKKVKAFTNGPYVLPERNLETFDIMIPISAKISDAEIKNGLDFLCEVQAFQDTLFLK